MTTSVWPRRIALLYEGRHQPGGLAHLFAAGFERHGCEVDLLARTAPWSTPYDLVVGYGPSTWEGTLLPVLKQLQSFPADQRPVFLWWYIECIPDPRLPLALVSAAARLRVALDRRLAATPEAVQTLRDRRLDRWLLKGFREKILGELAAFRAAGLLDALVVTSGSRARYLARHGFTSTVAPIGYHPQLHGQAQGLERDIPVGFLGNIQSDRRARYLRQVVAALAQRGIPVSIQTNLYGDDLIRFLNRTKIMLNIFREPYDFFGLRFLFCAANRALFVSEPVADHEPFVPGRHLVTAPLPALAETVAHYLAHPEERETLVSAAHQIVTEGYTIAAMAGRLLEAARAARPQRVTNDEAGL